MGLGAASRPGISPRLLVLATAVIAVLGVAAGLLTTHADSLFGGGNGGHPAGTQAARHPDKGRVIEQQLTRWRKFAFWVHPVTSAAVYAEPSTRSPVVTHLHPMTEDGFPEVYLVLLRRVAAGHRWLKIALPMRPNGTTGWVGRKVVGRLHPVRRWLTIDRTRLRAQFYRDGRRIWGAPVGIGKPETPTPNGLFWVREEFELPNQAFYGPYAFGTSAYANLSD